MSEIEGGGEAFDPSETALNLTAALGFQLDRRSDLYALFRCDHGRAYGDNRTFLPIAALPTLGMQLTGGVNGLPDHFGFVNTGTGWFEILIDDQTPRAMRGIAEVMEHFVDTGQASCRHTVGAAMPSTTDIAGSELARGRIHVSDSATGTCLEVSMASAAGVLFGRPNARGQRRFTRDMLSRWGPELSVKIDFGPNGDPRSLGERGTALATSFLFELAVRNGAFFELAGRARPGHERLQPFGTKTDTPVRFPTTAIKPEVAELFSFAESARGNPPLAYLSYYQVLEYFFPWAKQRKEIRSVRREVIDPRFDATSDAAILKIITSVGRASSGSEADQIKTLVTDSVREDRLTEFFAEVQAEHFGKTGPIAGVGYIGISDPRGLLTQVAERVYKIRNRIVHAKDDPKFAEAPVLLPRSREAYALGPDIALVRLLASEVIIDAQLS